MCPGLVAQETESIFRPMRLCEKNLKGPLFAGGWVCVSPQMLIALCPQRVLDVVVAPQFSTTKKNKALNCHGYTDGLQCP